MCAAACSVWWLGWILYKTTPLEGSYQCRSTPSTGAALLSASANGGGGRQIKTQPYDIQTKTIMEPWWPWLFFPSPTPLSLFASAFSSFEGWPPLARLKANRAAWTRAGKWVNTALLWRVCWLSDCVWWTFLILSLWCCIFSLLLCRLRCFEMPHPRLTCWTVTSKQMASIAAHGDPMTLPALCCLAERGCLKSLPGSITSFPPKQLKRLAV